MVVVFRTDVSELQRRQSFEDPRTAPANVTPTDSG
jgi:hypothetical protein